MHKFVNSSDEKVGGSKLSTTPTIAQRSSVSNKGSSADGAATPATVSVSAAGGGGGGGGGGIGSASSVPKSRRTSRASKSIKSDNGSLKSSKSRRSSRGTDLENLMTDEFGRVKFTGYNINKWVLYHRFHHDVKIIKQKIVELYKTSDAGEERAVATLSKDVSDYWENSMETGNASRRTSSEITKRRLNAAETQALLILQSQFRLWLELAKMRKQVMYTGFDMVSKIGTVQNAIRCFYAVRDVRLAEANQLLSADLFTEFCTLMVAGVQILMYSRKHGTAVKRTIKFTDDCKAITYVTNKWSPRRTFEIKQIYKVAKHLSTNVYPKARPKHKNWCFHLHLLRAREGVFLDFEPLSHADAQILLYGFTRLSKLSSSQSPFYIDKLGVPSRAVASIVRTSLKEDTPKAHSDLEMRKYKGCKSEADLMRFRAAIRGLSAEYAAWDKLKIEEEVIFRRKMRDLNLAKNRDFSGDATQKNGNGNEKNEKSGGAGGIAGGGHATWDGVAEVDEEASSDEHAEYAAQDDPEVHLKAISDILEEVDDAPVYNMEDYDGGDYDGENHFQPWQSRNENQSVQSHSSSQSYCSQQSKATIKSQSIHSKSIQSRNGEVLDMQVTSRGGVRFSSQSSAGRANTRDDHGRGTSKRTPRGVDMRGNNPASLNKFNLRQQGEIDDVIGKIQISSGNNRPLVAAGAGGRSDYESDAGPMTALWSKQREEIAEEEAKTAAAVQKVSSKIKSILLAKAEQAVDRNRNDGDETADGVRKGEMPSNLLVPHHHHHHHHHKLQHVQDADGEVAFIGTGASRSDILIYRSVEVKATNSIEERNASVPQMYGKIRMEDVDVEEDYMGAIATATARPTAVLADDHKYARVNASTKSAAARPRPRGGPKSGYSGVGLHDIASDDSSSCTSSDYETDTESSISISSEKDTCMEDDSTIIHMDSSQAPKLSPQQRTLVSSPKKSRQPLRPHPHAHHHKEGWYRCTFAQGAWIKFEPSIYAANIGTVDLGDVLHVSDRVACSYEDPSILYAQLHSGGWIRVLKDDKKVITHEGDL